MNTIEKDLVVELAGVGRLIELQQMQRDLDAIRDSVDWTDPDAGKIEVKLSKVRRQINLAQLKCFRSPDERRRFAKTRGLDIDDPINSGGKPAPKWWRVLSKRMATRDGLGLDGDAASLRTSARVSSVDEQRRCATFTITTPTPDRSNDTVDPLGANIANYARNPVVYYDHGQTGVAVPIGKCEDENGNLALSVTDEGIEATCFFAQSPEGEKIFDLVKQNVLRAASINFSPITYRSKMNGGLDISEWELLEWSVVGIPANAEALRKRGA
jgi:HK97 family phage prohead protease